MENKKNNTLQTIAWIVIIFCVIFLTALLASGILEVKVNISKNKPTAQTTEQKQEETITNSENNIKEATNIDMLYGTYSWSKKYTNESGNELNLNVKLVLNNDGTATYEASDGYASESTKGTFTYENNQIKYNREYYNYPNQENQKYDEDNKIEIFKVIDNNTLQNIYHDQETNLTKQMS